MILIIIGMIDLGRKKFEKLWFINRSVALKTLENSYFVLNIKANSETLLYYRDGKRLLVYL